MNMNCNRTQYLVCNRPVQKELQKLESGVRLHKDNSKARSSSVMEIVKFGL
jgi:hypothetical protein